MISTGIPKLDNFLNGGIHEGIVTDIFGASGTGKTHLAMQISINSLSKGGHVLFQDTTNEFRPERMLEMIKAQNYDSGLLDNVQVLRATNISEQMKLLKENMSDFSLIIIDNITDLFSFEYSKESQFLLRTIEFMKYMRSLAFFAITKNIPIVITNSVKNIDNEEKENLNKAIDLFTHQKIQLKKEKDFQGTIISFQKRISFSYLISQKGISEIPEAI